jgi:hypothetical protein
MAQAECNMKHESAYQFNDHWYYPVEVATDLDHADLPKAIKEEVLACAWEYARCVIPHYTNNSRYIAFIRTIIIGTVAEFRGDLFDPAATSNVLGFDLDEVLDTLFAGTPGQYEPLFLPDLLDASRPSC